MPEVLGVRQVPASSGASERLVSVLLVVTVALSIALPGLLGTATPLAGSQLGFGRHDAALTQVFGVTAAFVGLFVAAAAADRRGVRPVLLTALMLLLGAGVLLAGSFSAWSYLLGCVVVDAAVMGVLAGGGAGLGTRAASARTDHRRGRSGARGHGRRRLRRGERAQPCAPAARLAGAAGTGAADRGDTAGPGPAACGAAGRRVPRCVPAHRPPGPPRGRAGRP